MSRAIFTRESRALFAQQPAPFKKFSAPKCGKSLPGFKLAVSARNVSVSWDTAFLLYRCLRLLLGSFYADPWDEFASYAQVQWRISAWGEWHFSQSFTSTAAKNLNRNRNFLGAAEDQNSFFYALCVTLKIVKNTLPNRGTANLFGQKVWWYFLTVKNIDKFDKMLCGLTTIGCKIVTILNKGFVQTGVRRNVDKALNFTYSSEIFWTALWIKIYSNILWGSIIRDNTG